MRYIFLFISLPLMIFFPPDVKGQSITTGTLLNEMVDLKRLAELPEHAYKYIQFSSYDRRSTGISKQDWFANSDGFGDEPVPGFEKILKAPDENGIGEYLMCDINQPGAILRLMTAGINGEIRLFLDNADIPMYKGPAQDFFRSFLEKLSPGNTEPGFADIFSQRDAVYFPVPFAKRCRIEWTGDIRKDHFYHIGIRIYEPDCKVETFHPEDIPQYLTQIERIKKIWNDPEREWINDAQTVHSLEMEIPGASRKKIISFKGPGAVEHFILKLSGKDLNQVLRQNILNIWFDGSSVPQVQSPVGDFFGAAPGVNPYESLPFSVKPDGTMECRFFMPFKDSVRFEIENFSGQDVRLSGEIRLTEYEWKKGTSMYFGARWRINHKLNASNTNISDIPYLLAFGEGRIVGAAAFIYNPSNAPSSNGNWWGEGDEKIYVGQDTFPSLFGTGSEDYFNYSWSSPDIFSFPYSGQPRNDGPGNRGFASNYRWHIADDIPFNDKTAFYMELLHHGEIPDFSYGRTVYLYSLPGLMDDHKPISEDDVRELRLPPWSPITYRGSAGYRFINAEELIQKQADLRIEEGPLWADGKILLWEPEYKGDKIKFSFQNDNKSDNGKIIITFAHLPDGGNVSVFVNDSLTKFNRQNIISLHEPYHQVSRNHTSVPVSLKKGENEIIVEYVGEADNKKVGIDFFWIKR